MDIGHCRGFCVWGSRRCKSVCLNVSVLCLCSHSPDHSPPLGNNKKKKGNSKGPLPKWPPSCPVSHPLFTLAPQESVSPSGQSPQTWCGGAATVSPACLRFFKSHRVGYLLPGTSANVGKQDVTFWLSHLQEKKTHTHTQKLFLILCNVRHNHCFVRPPPIILVLKEISLVSVIVSLLLSLSLPLVLSAISPLCPAQHLCCLQTHHFRFSLLVFFVVFLFVCLFVFEGGSTLRNQLFCIYFIVIWVFSDLFFPFHFILSFPFGDCF